MPPTVTLIPWPNARTSLIVAIALILFGLLGCSQTTTTLVPTATSTPPQPQTRLEEALSKVPLGYADKIIEFADYATSRSVTGLEDVPGFEKYWQLDREQRNLIYRVSVIPHQA